MEPRREYDERLDGDHKDAFQWLHKHGYIMGGGIHTPHGWMLTWESHGKVRFNVWGSDDDNVFNILYRHVKNELWERL